MSRERARAPVPFETPVLPGLSYQDLFISEEEEAGLLHGVRSHQHQWKHLHNRTLQNWGGLPHIKGMLPTPLPNFLRPLCSSLVDAGVFPSAEAPNHVLVNRYEPGQGISPHEDGPAYKPRAAIVSLQAPIVMDFYRIGENTEGVGADDEPAGSVLLRPRSLLVLAGEVYTGFYHAIAERNEDDIGDTVLNAADRERRCVIRRERTSLTVRTSCKTIRNPLMPRLRR